MPAACALKNKRAPSPHPHLWTAGCQLSRLGIISWLQAKKLGMMPKVLAGGVRYGLKYPVLKSGASDSTFLYVKTLASIALIKPSPLTTRQR